MSTVNVNKGENTMPRKAFVKRPLQSYMMCLDPDMFVTLKAQCARDNIPLRTRMNVLLAQWCKEQGILPQGAEAWLAPLDNGVVPRDTEFLRQQRKYYRHKAYGYSGTFAEWVEAGYAEDGAAYRHGKVAVPRTSERPYAWGTLE
jgi:hypothetical protein